LNRPTESLVVSISVNREVKGDFFVERDTTGELFLKVEDTVVLMLKFSQERVILIGEEKFVSLSACEGVQYAFDEKNLAVNIIGRTTETKKTTIELYPTRAGHKNVYIPREVSAFLNYGLAYSYADPVGFQSLTASTRLGMSTGSLFFVSDALSTKTDMYERTIRLQSSATYEQRDELQWTVIGDQFASSGTLGSTVNMGGIGFSKVYRLDPYLITQPMFDLRGATAYPSQADIYLDGVLIGKQQIAPGSFELQNIYSHAGVHMVEVVLKDPFGKEQRITAPLYYNTTMLREGLHEYSYNAGYVRQQYGIQSNEYGKLVFSAFHRYGVSSSLNVGVRAEGGGEGGVYNGGVYTAFSVPLVGSFTMSGAGSNSHGMQGAAGSFQHSYQHGRFITNLAFSRYTWQYATVGAVLSPDPVKQTLGLSTGFSAGRQGSVSLNYFATEVYSGVRTRTVAAGHSRAISQATNLFATVSATRTAETIYAVYVGLNFLLDGKLRGTAQVSRTGEADMQMVSVQKDQPVGEGLGYRASLSRADTGSEIAYAFNPMMQYNARYGTYAVDAGVRNAEGKTTESVIVSASGSLVYAGGVTGISRPVSDSFSIVMVGDIPNVPVQNNGQTIGRTNASGTMVVPTLTSYNENQITVDTKNVPMDYSIAGVTAKMSPSLWSGSCVAYDVRQVRALTGTFVLQTADKKQPLENVDVTLRVGEKNITFPTGKGGEFYLENGLPDNIGDSSLDRQSCQSIAERRTSGGNVIQPGTYPATVDFEGGKCELFITFPKTDDAITEVGEIQCVVK